MDNQITYDIGRPRDYINNQVALAIIDNAIKDRCNSLWSVDIYFKEDLVGRYANLNSKETLKFLTNLEKKVEPYLKQYNEDHNKSMEMMFENMERERKEAEENGLVAVSFEVRRKEENEEIASQQ